MYTTHRYSLKIYHKGSEYTKHDRKEHKRINILKGKEYFKINELQSISDKILRYESLLEIQCLLTCTAINYSVKVARNIKPDMKSIRVSRHQLTRMTEFRDDW